MSEKTEQPTPKKIRDAREEGQVAKSQEVLSVVQLAVIIVWLMSQSSAMYSTLTDVIYQTIAVCNYPIGFAMSALSQVISDLIMQFVYIFAGALIFSTLMIGLLQTGFLIAPKSLMPSAKRINVISNVKQLFSLTKLFELFKMVVKILVLGLTFAYLIHEYAPSLGYLAQAELMSGLVITGNFLLWMFGVLLGVSAIFSIADYAVQYYQLRKQLMMSLEDIKQEFKNSEGNQEIKQKRRELHQEIQSGSLSSNVRKSSVVVRNPTHVAVCIHYEEGVTPLPQVLTYGRDQWALHIIAIAEAHQVPVVENVSLARALISSTNPGDYIPENLFVPVAQVLRSVRAALEDESEDEDNDESD